MVLSYQDGDWELSDYHSNDTTEEDVLHEICGPGEVETEAIRGFQSFMFCLIFLLGVAGNALVIATFALYRRHCLRSMTDIFLLHLALADLLLLLTLPLQGVDTYLGWVFSEPLCKATRAGYTLNTYSGLMLLACISVDRYVLVARPQEVLRLRSRLLAGGKLTSLAVWLAAFLLSVPEIRYAGVSVEGGDSYCVVRESPAVKRITSMTLITVFGLSSVVMVTCYSCVGKMLWAGPGEKGLSKRGGWRRQQRTLKLMAALVVVFLVFQLPYTVVLWHKMAAEAFCSTFLDYVTCTLAYSRCCLNPILYTLMGSRFRNDVRKLADATCCRRHLCRSRPRPLVVKAGKCSSMPTSSFPSYPSYPSSPPLTPLSAPPTPLSSFSSLTPYTPRRNLHHIPEMLTSNQVLPVEEPFDIAAASEFGL
ncbi:Atypical chemokine receptor 4 [Merluccius polli]|uniref:Atypical chemokine receptor 4 n=1 Tax=Merluccius polli TaxID=89951 RepID=A0AA47NP88_MERPO|nr:Atypical chemokine receptor 4 [Merluccius polli]